MSKVVEDKNQEPAAQSGWGGRLAWFAGIWLASVSVLGAVAWGLKKLLQLD